MDKINELPDELLVKILSFVPTKVAVSTSILSKRWECLWMWQPKLSYTTDFGCSKLSVREFIDKNLSLHRALVIESLHLEFSCASIQPEDIKKWVGITVSRCIGELSISYKNKSDVLLLPSSLYTCKSLVTLKLEGNILMDVPEMVSLPSLKTLRLRGVTYSNEEYILGVYSKGESPLQLLLSNCPVLEDLSIEQDYDSVGALVIIVPSLQRLSLTIGDECSCDEYVIVTPALKYFKVEDNRKDISYLIEHMPKLEEADIFVFQDIEKLLKSVKTVKRLSLFTFTNIEEEMYHVGVFNQLEHLKLHILPHCWLKLLFRLLTDSPKLRVLSLYAQVTPLVEDEQCNSLEGSFVPKCLLSLQTFEFEGYNGIGEEREFLSFLFRNARRLKFSTILPYIRRWY